MQLVGGTLVNISINGREPSTPYPLNGAGGVWTGGAVTFNTYKVYYEVDLNGLSTYW